MLKENKELAIQVIEDLIIEYEQKIEGYVASKQIHTCTDQVKHSLFFIIDEIFLDSITLLPAMGFLMRIANWANISKSDKVRIKRGASFQSSFLYCPMRNSDGGETHSSSSKIYDFFFIF